VRLSQAIRVTFASFASLAAAVCLVVILRLGLPLWMVPPGFLLMLSGPLAGLATGAPHLSSTTMTLLILSAVVCLTLALVHLLRPSRVSTILACLAIAYWILAGIMGTIGYAT
jgi:hypothetical protein